MTHTTFPSRHISISINCDVNDVYAFVSNPANLPKWAAGVSDSIRKSGDEWISDSPMGEVKIRFAPKNTFGIVDHDVTLQSGVTVSNPMRVLTNGDGSEVVFTLFRRPEMSDEECEKDAGMITGDLQTLKELLETTPDQRV